MVQDIRINLDDVAIGAPCNVDWKDMTGSNTVRTCSSCKLHVYNIAEMTRFEAEELLTSKAGGQVCLKLFRRNDGTLLTKDCSLVRRMIDRSRQKIRIFAAAIFGFFNVAPVFAQQLQQLGAVERFGYGVNKSQLDNSENAALRLKLRGYNGEGADTRALTYYRRGLALEQMNRISSTGALKAYNQALDIIRAKDFDWDSKFVDMVAIKCANLLDKNSDAEKANAVRKEFSLTKKKIHMSQLQSTATSEVKYESDELVDESPSASKAVEAAPEAK